MAARSSALLANEQLDFIDDRHVREGKVTLVEYLGSEIFVHLTLPSGQQLLVQGDGKSRIKMGDTAQVSFDPKAAHYFDGAGKRVPLYDAA